jgi:hypothetical protein
VSLKLTSRFPLQIISFEESTAFIQNNLPDSQFDGETSGLQASPLSVVLPFFMDLRILPNDRDGIWYSVSESSVAFQWRTTNGDAPSSDQYDYLVETYLDEPGSYFFTYFKMGSLEPQAIIGVQSDNGSEYSSS